MKEKIYQAAAVLCSICMLLFMAAQMTVTTHAAENGIYLATATPHYRHPGTGKIEDSGGDSSSVLGQSMTESATYKQALVEVDASGNTYITWRLQLMDNIQNPQFQVDAQGNGSFVPVSAQVMQEDYTNNTADFRMQVPGENAIVRCNMYVVAMGREVIFYLTVSNLTAGSGDFMTSVVVEPKQSVTQNQSQDTQVQTQTQPVQDSQSASVDNTTQQQNTAADTQTNAQQAVTDNTTASTAPQTSTEPVEAALSQEVSQSAADAETSTQAVSAQAVSETPQETEAAGLEEFDATGKKVEKEPKSSETETKETSSPAVWIVCAVIVVAAAGGGAWYVFVYRKHHKGDVHNEKK